MKSIKLLATCGLMTAISFSTCADSSFSVNGSFKGLSNYLWRGMSLSDDKPSLQADITLYHDSGFYIGGAFETYRYEGMTDIEDDYEIDYFAGYYTSLSDDLALGFTVQQYTYGDADSSTEFVATVDWFNTNLNAYYDKDLETWYADINYSFPTEQFGTFTLHAGYFFEGEAYWFMDGNEISETAYDLSVKYSYWPLDNLELLAEVNYQEFYDENYLIGIAYHF
ncbi:TorF family putative porin [Shewanella sp. D64]|uniref:TorF family putative porin n=1 Tax=unclassified Shewanella TaxID=196818 RepID=UPI0022BA5E89|nr:MULTISPECIES: TorF family putative porin [unclassified Shewanella]MEC4727152.1 TorF family putative porin [Shewanella sp. D64]MEC4739231.1 TorF family putative porin [Shewanella sp. E94]WBJ95571.1 TorF family putative porin [Shewanella sp. MTB7]